MMTNALADPMRPVETRQVGVFTGRIEQYFSLNSRFKTQKMNAKAQLQSALDAALTLYELDGAPAEVRQIVPATNPKFGDYQWNGALQLAKILGHRPREIAAEVLARIDVVGICAAPEIAGPGFVNFRLTPEYLEKIVNAARADARLGVETTLFPEIIAIDFSSPNVAKPMHVGHIRSTILGDALARMLRFKGHTVITDNHIGDWGTAFGKIIVGWKADLDEANLQTDPIGEMERLYKDVNERAKTDPALEDAARLETAKLQSGDAENRAIWERVRALSQAQFDQIYARLGIEFDYTLGESFYNDRLESLVDELMEAGVARASEGAIAVFSDGAGDPKTDPFLINRDGEWTDAPTIVRKSDGAATYATTDLATLEYRLDEWAPNEIIYVTDSRQGQHFRQVFEAFSRWKGASAVELEHAGFGMILGEDRAPFKTREGGVVRLTDLLDEAEARARQIAREVSPDLEGAPLEEVGRVLGIGAVKYADLSSNRASDYVFSWDKAVALSGNSAVYLEYAYVRTRSIARRAQEKGVTLDNIVSIDLIENSELELARTLARFGEALDDALEDYRPHLLCDYLYELAGKFAAFYRDCPILKEPMPAGEVQRSRLALTQLAGDVLGRGLGLLGIETLEAM